MGSARSTSIRKRVYRHSALVRVTHWLNAASLLVLLLSGLNIFMAEPALYFGQASTFAHPLAAIEARRSASGALFGEVKLGDARIITTGLLGVSPDMTGHPQARAFPRWMTLPASRDLATARRWHFFFAWMLVFNAALYGVNAVLSGHFKRDIALRRGELGEVPRSIMDHLRLRHPTGEAAATYNVLQKIAYIAVLLILVPGMVITGLAMSPGMDAVLPFLTFVLGGRQTARSLHFLCAWSLVGFFLIHMLAMVMAGPINEMRSIITGWYTLPRDHDTEEEAA